MTKLVPSVAYLEKQETGNWSDFKQEISHELLFEQTFERRHFIKTHKLSLTAYIQIFLIDNNNKKKLI